MDRHVKHATGWVALFCLANTGCIVGQGSCIGGATIWTEPVTERLELDASGITALNVQTHNGSIEFSADSSVSGGPVVTVTKKGGARTRAGAEEAFQAIDVFVKDAGSGVRQIGWRWKRPKRSNWSARVNFEIHASDDTRFDATTHNGSIDVDGAGAELKLVSHNGRITVSSKGDRLAAETHNGRISATFSGSDITLLSHNGAVTAALEQCSAIEGSIKTYNGAVKVSVGSATSANLACNTHNGSIACDAPLTGKTTDSRRSLKGTLGQGGGTLAVITHNGSIKIKQPAS